MKTPQDIQALLTNPEIFEINRLKAHVLELHHLDDNV